MDSHLAALANGLGTAHLRASMSHMATMAFVPHNLTLHPVSNMTLTAQDVGGGAGSVAAAEPGCPEYSAFVRNFGVWLWVLLILYIFYSLAVVCDEYFVPALQIMCDKLKIPDDVAGATFMAIGASSPEMFTNFIAIFIEHSAVGSGTIVGSEIFNMLMICGFSALLAQHGVLRLDWRPFARDVFFYGLSIGMLYWTLADGVVSKWESLALVLCYLTYALVCSLFSKIVACTCPMRGKKSVVTIGVHELEKPLFEADEWENVDQIAQDDKQHFIVGTDKPSDFYPRSASELPLDLINRNIKNKEGWLLQRDRFQSRMSIATHGWCRLWFCLVGGELQYALAPCHKVTVHGLRPGTSSEQVQHFETVRRFSAVVQHNFYDPMHEEEPQKHILGTVKLSGGCECIDKEGVDFELKMPSGRTLTFRAMDPATKNSWVAALSLAIQELGPAATTVTPSVTEDILTGEEEAAHDDLSPFRVPLTPLGKVEWVLSLPLKVTLWATTPNVRAPGKEGHWMSCFAIAMVWLAIFSYVMCFSADTIACIWGIPAAVMGLTLAAAGTSFPNLVSSVLVAQQGLGNMAVSNAFGSNVFNIFFALGFPWLLKTWIQNPEGYSMDSDDIVISVFILAASLVLFVMFVVCNRMKMGRVMGYGCILCYGLFLIFEVAANAGWIPGYPWVHPGGP
uniref:PH domain-containing protein n=1 Tax=Vitrella brassicaformis TaxID=1169539 RepID=A0A7S1KCU3_9ALVE|mmetsp:Transcript_47915/g.119865  ORF Transcript_47915/g.119865 Transcript_47915/m.119865 type:complete len:679 (+) Transcript_47915:151-2187(+)